MSAKPHKNSVNRKLSLWAIGFLLTVGTTVAGWAWWNRPHPPLEIGFWYWHSPYSIDDKQAALLKNMGAKKMFVRAGTFSSNGKDVVLAIPQKYERVPDVETHLVFNFDSGVIRHFEDYDLEVMSEQVATRIDKQLTAAESKGITAAGIQLDFDVPTRLLPRYGQFVKLVRSKLRNPKITFSSSALLSWLTSKGITTLTKELDFIVPQAYEMETGKTFATFRPISDPDSFKKWIAKTDNLACPYYVGLPTYGRALLYDDKGKLVGNYPGLSPQDAFRHPSFQNIAAYISDAKGVTASSDSPSVGEEIVTFKAIAPGRDGRGEGYTLAYCVPTPEQLSIMLRAIRKIEDPKMKGVILYRFPEEGSSLSLSLDTVGKVLAERGTQPKLKVTLHSGRNSYEMIESEKPDPQAPIDLYVEIENIGDEPTFIGPGAVEVKIKLDVPGIDDGRRGDMDELEMGHIDEKDGFESYGRLENGIRMAKYGLMPEEKAFAGPIRLRTHSPQKALVSWHIKDSDGRSEHWMKQDIKIERAKQ